VLPQQLVLRLFCFSFVLPSVGRGLAVCLSASPTECIKSHCFVINSESDMPKSLIRKTSRIKSFCAEVPSYCTLRELVYVARRALQRIVLQLVNLQFAITFLSRLRVQWRLARCGHSSEVLFRPVFCSHRPVLLYPHCFYLDFFFDYLSFLLHTKRCEYGHCFTCSYEFIYIYIYV
jgi:hypothetical protein